MFSIKESVKYGWNKSKEHLELVLFSTLLVLAIGSLVGSIDDHRGGLNISTFGFVGAIFMIIIRIGYNKIFLRIHDGESPKFVEIFQEYRIFWRYLSVSILFPLAVLGGFILLVIPGIIWAVRFSFSPLIVIDTKIGPVASMKESYAITKGYFLHLLFFWIALAAINFLGLIFFGIGLLVTIPVTTLAAIHVYRELYKAKAGLIKTSSPQAV
jgi:uncharacterized membrane protein